MRRQFIPFLALSFVFACAIHPEEKSGIRPPSKNEILIISGRYFAEFKVCKGSEMEISWRLRGTQDARCAIDSEISSIWNELRVLTSKAEPILGNQLKSDPNIVQKPGGVIEFVRVSDDGSFDMRYITEKDDFYLAFQLVNNLVKKCGLPSPVITVVESTSVPGSPGPAFLHLFSIPDESVL